MSSRDFVARFMFTVQAFTIIALATAQDNSIPAFSTKYGDGLPYAVILFGVGVFLSIDLVINDLMPEKYSFPFALRMRHWIYPMASLSYMSLLFISQQGGKSVELGAILMYSAMAFFGFLLSFRNVLFFRGQQACNS